MPRLQQKPRRRDTIKPQKPGTPIRNSLLILIFAALLTALVLLLPTLSSGQQAVVLAPGAEGTGGAVEGEEILLRISEVMSSNRSAYPDETGAYPDWVEVVNEGETALNLKGIGLSDREDRVLFLFPDMTLEPGERALVFCDDTNVAEAGSPLHARFKISSLGETVYLFDRNAIVVDSVELPAMSSDMSYADTGDGWIITEQFTPGYPNTPAGYEQMRSAALGSSDGLVINELLAVNRTSLQDEDGEFSDWIEIYNGGTLPVTLSNYALSDDETEPVKWRFPQNVVLQPGEYYVVFASGKNRTGGDGLYAHTNFRLSAEGETVILSDILGQPVDRATYDNLDDDVSWGRIEELTSSWQTYLQPTPGYPNNYEGELSADARIRQRNGSGVFISEVMTSSTGVDTPLGWTSYDWIELVNLGQTAVNLKDWGLSDNLGRPRKWQLPDVTIQPGEYLLIFPSGLSESPTGSGAIHANYRLSALGETIVLSNSSGYILDKLVVPKLETDNSYGRDFDQGGLFYYETPTPGAKNGEGFSGYAAQPTVSPAGGVYASSVTVSMQAPEGVTILYTLDGSEPTAENGTLYEGPIAIDKVAVLRARGFADGLKASEITTETYLLNTYHSLPVICLTVDPVDLWDPSTGIYADGIDIDAVYGTLPSNQLKSPPFDEATYWIVKDDTSLREKAGNFEMYTAEGEQLLNQGVAVQLHGQFSLDLAQKSFRITAKAKYGSETLAYPFFEDRPFTEYKAVLLRNGGNDGAYTRIIDSLQSKIVDWTDSEIIHMASTPVIVYLNGEYWGHYNLRERINEHSIAAYEGWSDPKNVDLIKGDNDVLNGSYDNYGELLDFVESHDLATDAEALQTVLDWVDVDNYFDFMIFEMYFGNTDTGNIKFYRRNAEGEKWKWILFDLDWGLYNRNNDGCFIWLDPDGSGSRNFDNTLIRALLEVPELEEKFLTRYGYLYQNFLSDTDRILALMDDMVAEIQPEMGLHFNRWAGETSKLIAFDPPSDPTAAYNYWYNRIYTYTYNVIRARPYYVWGHVQEWFELSDEEMTAYFGPRPENTEDR